jgi:hypothetical protein
MGTPLYLHTVVDNGESLDVGNADLFSFTSGLVTQAGPDGLLFNPSTEQGFFSSVDADGCGLNSVTVNAITTASWSNGSDATAWHWQDLQQAFATALWAVMQHAGNSQNYPNYRYTAIPWGKTGRVACRDPKFLYWGHHIPAAIRITAYDNDNDGAQVGEVTVTYSTEGQSGGGDVCGAINDLNGVLAVFPPTSELAAIFGAVTTIFCNALGG